MEEESAEVEEVNLGVYLRVLAAAEVAVPDYAGRVAARQRGGPALSARALAEAYGFAYREAMRALIREGYTDLSSAAAVAEEVSNEAMLKLHGK